jgi:hypothetical protein
VDEEGAAGERQHPLASPLAHTSAVVSKANVAGKVSAPNTKVSPSESHAGSPSLSTLN